MMPSFSPCGMICDVLRSCYSTKMYFFGEDNPPLRARWYFTTFTECLPYPSNFVSNNWLDLDRGQGPTLEVPNSGTWNRGNQTPDPITGVACGNPDYFLTGDASATVVQPIIPELPPCCTEAFQPLVVNIQIAAAHLQIQFGLAVGIWAVQQQNAAALTLLCNWLFQGFPYVTYNYFTATDPYVAFSQVVQGNQSVFFIPGVQNEGNLLQSIMSGLIPLREYGGYKAGVYYHRAALAFIQNFVYYGIGPTFYNTYAGHSLGGAVGAIAAARSIIANSTLAGLQRVVSFGAPRPGDQRLVNLLNTYGNSRDTLFEAAPWISVSTFEDAVPWLPPQTPFSLALAPLVGLLTALRWNEWAAPPTTWFDFAGTRVPEPSVWDGLVNLAGALADYLAGGPITPIATHGVDYYARTLYRAALPFGKGPLGRFDPTLLLPVVAMLGGFPP